MPPITNLLFAAWAWNTSPCLNLLCVACSRNKPYSTGFNQSGRQRLALFAFVLLQLPDGFTLCTLYALPKLADLVQIYSNLTNLEIIFCLLYLILANQKLSSFELVFLILSFFFHLFLRTHLSIY